MFSAFENATFEINDFSGFLQLGMNECSESGLQILKIHSYHWKLNNSSLEATERVTDLDQKSEMIIFGLILTNFELCSIFGGSWAVLKIGLSLKPSGNLACPNL